jgi:phosphoglycerol transferase MdoB-like AlkP superfamily enzyme
LNKKHYYFSINGYIANILFVLLLSAVLSFIGILLSDVVNLTNLLRYIRSPLLFALNTLPLALLLLLLYHLTSRHWLAFGIGGGLYIIAHVINRFMMQLREEPLTPQDIVLGVEAARVIKISELPFSPIVVLSLLFWLFISLGLFFFVRSRPLGWKSKIAGALAVAFIFSASIPGFYKKTNLYNSFEVAGSEYSRVNLFKSRGFVYSFLYRAANYKSIKPEEYSKDEAQQILANYEEAPYALNSGIKPHIIAVMGEAFYDIDRIEGIEFNNGFDPLENFNNITGQAYSGRIVASVFGGGTANTEFSFLTGHSMPIMPELSSPYSYYIRKNTFSLTRILEEAGYASMAFHPGESWFYNRSNVYKFFGFDKIYFKKDMDINSVEVNNGYISDISTAEYTLDKFRSHLATDPERPFFEFVVDIDNHGPYSKRDLGYPEILKRKDTMDEATYNILNNYIYGLKRCDRALGYLVDSIGKMDEPVIFLYFADHLPFLGENNQGYKALGFKLGQDQDLEAYLNQYETPWFIWCNSAAEALLAENGITVKKGEAPLISPNCLASELLEFIGQEGGSYFHYLSGLKEKLPVITNRFTMENGVFTEELSEESKALIDQYSKLQYYLMLDKEYTDP